MGAGEKQAFVERHYLPLLLAILALCTWTRTVRLGVPEGYHYDERYHAFTAARMAEGDPRVYDPRAVPPKDVAYEWTHPPLGKLAMAAGILAFGDDARGWRASSVVFGVGVVAVSAWLALLLFASRGVSLLTAWFLTFDGLVFVQSRIAMIDIHLTFFLLLSLAFYARWRASPDRLRDLLLAGFAAGLALATKWSAAAFFVALAVDLGRALARRELPAGNWIAWLALAFGAIPLGVYVGAYGHFFALGHSLGDFVKLQAEMVGYHSRLEATHAYAVGPLHWILDLRPTWFFVDYQPDSIANIYNLGNHVVFYGGLVGAAWCARRLVREGGWSLWIVLLAYLLLWVPWLFSPRITFFYHYTPAVPFLSLMLSLALYGHNRDLRSGRVRHASYWLPNVMVAAAVWFVVFYPFLAAVHVPKPFVDLLYLLVLPRPA